jgi:hypothetical protein
MKEFHYNSNTFQRKGKIGCPDRASVFRTRTFIFPNFICVLLYCGAQMKLGIALYSVREFFSLLDLSLFLSFHRSNGIICACHQRRNFIGDATSHSHGNTRLYFTYLI